MRGGGNCHTEPADEHHDQRPGRDPRAAEGPERGDRVPSPSLRGAEAIAGQQASAPTKSTAL